MGMKVFKIFLRIINRTFLVQMSKLIIKKRNLTKKFDLFMKKPLKFKNGHKTALAVLGKMFVLSGSTCNCNLTKPCLTLANKSQYTSPNPAGGFLDLAQSGSNLPQPLALSLVARVLISKVTKNSEIYFETAKVDRAYK